MRAVFFLLLLFSSYSSAGAFYWQFSDSTGTYRRETGEAICAINIPANFKLIGSPKGAPTAANTGGNCSYYWSTIGQSQSREVRSYGCPADQQFDTATNTCAVPAPTAPPGQSCQREGNPLTGFGFITNSSGQCVDYANADTPSQCKSLSGRTGATTLQVTFDSDGNPLTPPPISVQGCEAQAYGVAHCKMAPVRKFPTGGSIQSSINKCTVDVKFTGNTSGQGSPVILPPGSPNDGVCDPSSPCPPPQDPPIQNDHKPCVYVYDGEGRRVCSSNKWNANPGQTSCGTVNGQFQCIGKAPTSNGIFIDTTVTDTQNADGTTTSVKDDKITQTTCTGAYSCNTTVTNNKTSIIKDMGGNTIGQSSQCTGPHCSKDGQDDADGDGLKDCIGIGCGLGSGSGPGTGIGDEGEGGEFSGPENSEVAGFGETTSQFMSRVQGSPIVAAASGLTFASGGSCSFGSFTVPMLGTLSFQPICAWAADWLGPLRAIMLAVWALVAIRTFFEA